MVQTQAGIVTSLKPPPPPPPPTSTQSVTSLAEIRAKEWYKCRNNPLYFIFNYVYIPETGGRLKYDPDKMHNKIRRVVRSVFYYHKCVLMASRQLGKALSLDTHIPQPDGQWTTMGDLKVGDIILGADGKPTTVTFATDIMTNHNCYKVNFDYHDSIIADEEHLWKISWSPGKRYNKIKTTKQIKEMVESKTAKAGRPYIDCCEPIHNSEKLFPIDPYYLGLWLGDGCSDGARINCHKDDYLEYIDMFNELHIECADYKPSTDDSGYFRQYNIWEHLNSLNLIGSKHIPRQYFSGSFNQRLDLLKGLMDSDGTCSVDGSCEFYQKDINLAQQVRELLASLGIKSRLKVRTNIKGYEGEEYHSIKFCTARFYVFNLKRKRRHQDNCDDHPKNYKHFITSVEPVESVPVRCIQVDNDDHMFLCGEMIPTHNTTIAAALLAWATIFYPGIKAVILNMKKNAALNNINAVKFIIGNCPEWMVTDKPFKQKGDIKTYCDLFNDSRVEVFYPSTVHSPSTLARSLTVPILYIDEAAFIVHMRDIYGSAQQTLATARDQAMKNHYPYFQLVTSTPNGTDGDGEWFYKRWNGCVDSDDLFREDENGLESWRTDIDVAEAVANPAQNTFVKVKYHWSEDPRKSNEWYRDQVQELDDKRLVNQELDLLFVGGSNCIFDDDDLAAFDAKKAVSSVSCPHSTKMHVFAENMDPREYYIIGVDTAQSLTGAYCAIQIYTFKGFNQVAEWQAKLGSYKYFGEVIHFVFQWLYRKVGERIILSIENNTIGQAPIEHLTKYIKDFNYDPYMYYEMKDAKDGKPAKKAEEPGIKTTGQTKPLMVGCLQQCLTDNIKSFKSSTLISQCSAIQRTANGGIKSNTYSDLFMATCFCAYTRLKKSIEILPLIEFSSEQISDKMMDDVKLISGMMDPKKNLMKPDINKAVMVSGEEDITITPDYDDDDDTGIFMPFFDQ